MQKKVKCKLTKYQKNYDKWSSGYDWLRVKIIDNLDLANFGDWLEKVTLADYDNSNFVNFYYLDHIITFVRLQSWKGTMYIWSISFRDLAVPICVLETFSKYQQEFTGQVGGFVLYGSFFRLVDIWYIKNISWWLKESIYKKINELYISRVDYRFDFFTNDKNKKLPTPWNVINVRANTRIFYDTNGKITRKKQIWDITGWRAWSKSAKRILTRAYDKLLDSDKKGKRTLYADYFEWEKVHRIEYEFLNSYTSDFRVIDMEKLKTKIFGTLGFNPKIGNDFKTYDKIDLSDIQKRFRYADTTRGYMLGCVQNGINIFWLLDDVFQKSWYWVNEIQDLIKEYLKKYEMSEFYATESDKVYYLSN